MASLSKSITQCALWLLDRIAKDPKPQRHNPVRKKLHYGPQVLKPEWGKTYPKRIKQPSRSSIRQLASQMAWEANEQIDGTRYLYREIMANGGIKPHKDDYLKREYDLSVPNHYRRRGGMYPDDMANTLGYETESELYEAIDTSERLRQQLTASLPNGKHLVRDFLDMATDDLTQQLNPE